MFVSFIDDTMTMRSCNDSTHGNGPDGSCALFE